jgi:hypothetical protein
MILMIVATATARSQYTSSQMSESYDENDINEMTRKKAT